MTTVKKTPMSKTLLPLKMYVERESKTVIMKSVPPKYNRRIFNNIYVARHIEVPYWNSSNIRTEAQDPELYYAIAPDGKAYSVEARYGFSIVDRHFGEVLIVMDYLDSATHYAEHIINLGFDVDEKGMTRIVEEGKIASYKTIISTLCGRRSPRDFEEFKGSSGFIDESAVLPVLKNRLNALLFKVVKTQVIEI